MSSIEIFKKVISHANLGWMFFLKKFFKFSSFLTKPTFFVFLHQIVWIKFTRQICCKISNFSNIVLDTSKLNINTNLKFEDLINSANGSPNQLLKNFEIWNSFSDEIINKLDSPIKNSMEILEISKSISEKLEILQQICLVNLIQTIWWRKTKNIGLVKKLENLKYLLRKKIQPRLAWEITFLKISMEDIWY